MNSRSISEPPGAEHHALHIPYIRTVPLPEPVDGSWIGWRRTLPWEAGLVVEARHRERRAELALLAGLF